MKAEGITDRVRLQVDEALSRRNLGQRAAASDFIGGAQRLRNRERQRRLAERAKLQAEIERLRAKAKMALRVSPSINIFPTAE
jgi:hypothetical protein